MVIWDIWGWWPWSALQGLHGLSSLLLAHDARTERARILKCCHGRVTIRVWTKNYIHTYIHTYIHHHSWMNISVFPFSSFAVIPRGTHFNNFNKWMVSKIGHNVLTWLGRAWSIYLSLSQKIFCAKNDGVQAMFAFQMFQDDPRYW